MHKLFIHICNILSFSFLMDLNKYDFICSCRWPWTWNSYFEWISSDKTYLHVFDTDICVVSWYISTKGAIRLSESVELNKQSQLYSKHDVIIAPKLVDFFHKGTIMWGFDVLALCEVGSTHKRPVIKKKLHEILMCKDCKLGIMPLWYRSYLLAVLLNYCLFMKYVPTQTF